MEVFDFGLALISFLVIWILQGRNYAPACETFACAPDSPWWRVPNWPFAMAAAIAMLIGGSATSRFEPPTEHVARRFIRRTLIPLFVAFPVSSLPLAVFLCGGWTGDIPHVFVVTLLMAVVKFGIPALIVTAAWAVVYIGVERRIAAR